MFMRLGILLATYGEGSLGGSVSLTLLGDIKHKGFIVMTSALIFARGMLVFAFSRNLEVTLVSLFFTGVSAM